MYSTREDSRYKNGQGTAHLGRHIILNKAVRVVYDVLKPLDLVVSSTPPLPRLLAPLRFWNNRWKPLLFISQTMFRLGFLLESTHPLAQFSKWTPRKSTFEPVPFNRKRHNVLYCKYCRPKYIYCRLKNTFQIIHGTHEEIIRLIKTKIIHAAKHNYWFTEKSIVWLWQK